MESLITNPMRHLKGLVASVTKYAFGKGLVTLGVMLATFASGGPVLWPVVVGFVAWKSYRLFSGYNDYKDDMLKIYRSEIAQQLGCDESAVTRDHLRMMARGDAVLGIEPNPIIAEALDRRRGMALLSFCTALLSATVTGLLLGVNAQGALEGPVSKFLADYLPNIGDFATKASVGTISALSGLIVHNGLDAVVGQSLGYFRATAHDRIALIARQKEYGVKVAPQQIFDVFLAANPTFARQVSTNFNKGITGFTAAEKMAAMKSIGVVDAMQELANQINNGELKAGTLAFELDGTHAMRVLQKVRGSGYEQGVPQQSVVRQHAPATEAVEQEHPATRFAERFAPNAQHTSFVEAEAVRREQHAHKLNHSI